MENNRAGAGRAAEPALAPLDAAAKRRFDAWVAGEIAYHHGICDGLETLADQLPARVDPLLVGTLLGVVERSWLDHIRVHRELLPLLTSVRSGIPELGLLAAEQHQISGVNDEAVEQLLHLSRGEPVNSDTLGYILRTAFESRRRHLAWERAVLLRLANGILSQAARRGLTEWCASHPGPVLPYYLRTRDVRH